MLHELEIRITKPLITWISKLLGRIWRPSFIINLEPFFLLNWPWLWASKFYFAFYHGFLVTVFISLVAAFYPITPSDFSNIWFYLAALVIFEIAILNNWISEIFQNNLERQFGQTPIARGWLETLVYILCVAVLVLPTISFFVILDNRIPEIVESPELTQFIIEYEGLLTGTASCNEALQKNIPIYDFDYVLIGKYSGQPISNDGDAQSQLCSALSTAKTIYDFHFSNEGSTLGIIYLGMLGSILFGGWIVFACKLTWEKYWGYLLMVLLSFLMPFLLYLIMSFVLNAVMSPENVVRISGILFWGIAGLWAVVNLIEILSINRQKIYSTITAVSIGFFPGTVVLLALGLAVLVGPLTTAIGYVFLLVGAALLFLLIPFVKRQGIALLSLPRE